MFLSRRICSIGIFLICLSTIGCTTAYTGLYFIKRKSENSLSLEKRKKEARAVQVLFTETLGRMGFFFTSDRYSTSELFPDVIAEVPPVGLVPPYNSLLDKKDRKKLYLAASFDYPYSITIRDDRTKNESELVKLIRVRLDSALNELNPDLEWYYHHDKIQLN